MKLIQVVLVTLLYSSLSHANVVGSDIQNFNPTTNGIDFVTVHSSETLDPGVFNFGFFLNYAVNTMPNYEDVTTGSRTDFKDDLTGGDLNFGVGITENWDFGFSAPQVYAQDTEDNRGVFSGRISQTGLTEYRFNTKYRIKGDFRGGYAVVGSVNFNQVENNPFTGSDPGPTLNIEGIYDFRKGYWNYGVNVGYRFRDPGTQIVGVPIEPYGDALIASIAASRYLEKYDMKLIAEAYASYPTEDTDATTDRDLSTTELLLGVKKLLRHDLALHAGGGTELYQGSSSPDWRIYTGINWNIGPYWGEETRGSRLLKPGNIYAGTVPISTSERFLVGDVLFVFDSDEISEAFKGVLLDLAAYLKESGFKKLVVEGHTDSVGPNAYNLDLSERRALSVVKFLTGPGKLKASNVDAVGYGETRPVAENYNFQGRSKNRRVEFNVAR